MYEELSVTIYHLLSLYLQWKECMRNCQWLFIIFCLYIYNERCIWGTVSDYVSSSVFIFKIRGVSEALSVTIYNLLFLHLQWKKCLRNCGWLYIVFYLYIYDERCIWGMKKRKFYRSGCCRRGVLWYILFSWWLTLTFWR